MQIKKNVRILGIRPELLLGISILDNLYYLYFGDYILITSCTESTAVHSRKSLHYSGGAVDFRRYTMDDSIEQAFILEAQISLGSEFDLVVESDHYHLEYQPKKM